jgi:hypothetical protein
MEKLRTQYRTTVLSSTVGVAALYWYLYYTYGNQLGTLKELLPLVGLSVPVIAGAIILFYERIGWRLINRPHDFAGDWHFVGTQYSVDPVTKEYSEAYDVWGTMTIEQSIDSIEISSGETYKECKGESPHLGTWKSISFDQDKSGTQLVVALDHQMSPARKSGNTKYGLEIFTAVKWHEGFFGRGHPIEMSSEVYHCIERAAVPHRMTTHYIRLPADARARRLACAAHRKNYERQREFSAVAAA